MILGMNQLGEVILMEVCPYLEETFKIVGKSWNGLIINYLSQCPEQTAHFSEIKRDLKKITPRSLSMKLSELGGWGLVEKQITSKQPVQIRYQLTEKGVALAEALKPLENWAHTFINLEQESAQYDKNAQ